MLGQTEHQETLKILKNLKNLEYEILWVFFNFPVFGSI